LGKKAFTGYLGSDVEQWKAWDATELVSEYKGDKKSTILIDQGTDDEFLKNQLNPDKLQAACKKAGQAIELRYQEGYDHSYFFISTFIDDHVRHHAKILNQA